MSVEFIIIVIIGAAAAFIYLNGRNAGKQAENAKNEAIKAEARQNAKEKSDAISDKYSNLLK